MTHLFTKAPLESKKPKTVKDPELALAESLYCFHARKGKRKKQHSRSQVGLRAVGEKSRHQSFMVNHSLFQKQRVREWALNYFWCK